MKKWGALLFLMTLLVGCHSVDGNEEIIETPLTQEESVAYDSNQSPIETDGVFVEKEDIKLSIECPVEATINSAVDAFHLTMSEDQLGAIIHEPTVEQLAQLDSLEVLLYEEEGWSDRLLIIPKEVGTTVAIYSTWYDGERFIDGEPVFNEMVIEQFQVIDVRSRVPEGIPNLKVVMEYKEKKVEYLMTYDGRGDRAQVEYLEVSGE
jgi:hypothetical protein